VFSPDARLFPCTAIDSDLRAGNGCGRIGDGKRNDIGDILRFRHAAERGPLDQFFKYVGLYGRRSFHACVHTVPGTMVTVARTERWLRTVQSETPVPPKVGFET
jgi:hypothetical protein